MRTRPIPVPLPLLLARTLALGSALACADAPPTAPGEQPAAVDAALPVVLADGAAPGELLRGHAATPPRGAPAAGAAGRRPPPVSLPTFRVLCEEDAPVLIREVGLNNRGQFVGWGECGLIRQVHNLPDLDPALAPVLMADISDSGLIVGDTGDVLSGAVTHGVLWRPGVGLTDIGEADARALNDAGQVVGERGGHAFLWEAGAGLRDLGTLPGDALSTAADINAKGQVVGSSAPDPGGAAHAFLWEAGAGMRELRPLPGFTQAQAGAVNDAGQVAGSSGFGFGDLSERRATLWAPGGAPEDLGTLPGYDACDAVAINAAGQVAGTCTREDIVDLPGFPGTGLVRSFQTAFFWDRAAGMVALGGVLGEPTTAAFDLNDAAQVVGTGSDNFIDQFGETPHALLWTVGDASVAVPAVDRLQAVALPPGADPTGLAPDGGVWLRVRLTDPGDAGPWDWTIDWGDDPNLFPPDAPSGVRQKGEFAFVRRRPYAGPGTMLIVVRVTDSTGRTSPVALTTVTVR